MARSYLLMPLIFNVILESERTAVTVRRLF